MRACRSASSPSPPASDSMNSAYEGARRHPTVTTLSRLLAAADADLALSLTHDALSFGQA